MRKQEQNISKLYVMQNKITTITPVEKNFGLKQKSFPAIYKHVKGKTTGTLKKYNVNKNTWAIICKHTGKD